MSHHAQSALFIFKIFFTKAERKYGKEDKKIDDVDIQLECLFYSGSTSNQGERSIETKAQEKKRREK